MGVRIKAPFVIHFGGTSYTNGPLAAPPVNWVLELVRVLRADPRCEGDIVAVNTGKGSQQSTWGVAQAGVWAPQRPALLVSEGYGVNNCVALPSVRSIADCNADFDAIVGAYRAENPDIAIIHWTPCPASPLDANRSSEQEYFDAELARAALNGVLSVNTTPLWVNGLLPEYTVGGDNLHPTWDAFKQFSFAPLVAAVGNAMAAHFA
jgi:hypothetical protein